MPTPLIFQEIYLLKRFCSLEYFGRMRDAWQAMLTYAEDLLSRQVANLPPGYRKRPLPEQADIVWGGRVLRNFRSTMRVLDDGYIRLSHGDYTALSCAHGVTNDRRGQMMDYPPYWMNEVEPDGEQKYYDLIGKASSYASPIAYTSSAIWSPGDLTVEYDEIVRQPLNPPPSWPVYRLNRQVTVQSGGRVPQTGIYLPDADHGFPTLLIQSDDPNEGKAKKALVVIDPSASMKREYRPVRWTLVERIADENPDMAARSVPSISSKTA